MIMDKNKKRKFVKKVKLRIPWIEHVLEDYRDALDLNLSEIEFKISSKSLCIYCRGARNLCGKSRCPVILKLKSYFKVRKLISGCEISGSSPPAIFIGRFGYPMVYAGPLIPPIIGDTSIYDYPEIWIGYEIDDIIDFRFKLIRGKFLVNVKKPYKYGKLMDLTQELALARSSVDTEAYFKKEPGKTVYIDGYVQPMGPSAPLVKMNISSNPKVDKNIEKAYYDYDLKASEAILDLYWNKVPISRIQRAFSAGLFGIRNSRRLVPTRWSITAVDSIISRRLRDEIVKRNPIINEFRVYEYYCIGTKFIVLMIPEAWSYELIEAWYPGSAWNLNSSSIAIGGDWENYDGRTTYASIGGCYYAARLAVTEYLTKIGRQASVIVLRESYPEHLLPLGVWIVREGVRRALESNPVKFNDLNEALQYIKSRLSINLKYWFKVSKILDKVRRQRKLTSYLR